jgi:hypothetical protein
MQLSVNDLKHPCGQSTFGRLRTRANPPHPINQHRSRPHRFERTAQQIGPLMIDRVLQPDRRKDMGQGLRKQITLLNRRQPIGQPCNMARPIMD